MLIDMPLSKHTMDQWVVAESGLVLPEATVQARRKPTCIDLFAAAAGFSLRRDLGRL